jgi:hypothetical protein
MIVMPVVMSAPDPSCESAAYKRTAIESLPGASGPLVRIPWIAASASARVPTGRTNVDQYRDLDGRVEMSSACGAAAVNQTSADLNERPARP